jgi:hypothetical protein
LEARVPLRIHGTHLTDLHTNTEKDAKTTHLCTVLLGTIHGGEFF